MNVNGLEITDCGGKYSFDKKEADDRCWFIENHCWHTESCHAGQKFKLESWQREIVRALFGWKHTDTGARRFRFLFLFLPRKNGKTALCSALVQCCLYMDGEPGAQNICAASSRDQAAHLYKMLSNSIQSDPTLEPMTHFQAAKQRLTVGTSEVKVIAAEGRTAHGANLHVSVLDELHTWKGERGMDLYNALRTGRANRAQPLFLMLTTAGIDFESVCYEQYKYARSITDGEHTDESYLPVIFEAAPMDDWQDEAIWRKANPNLGITIHIETLRQESAAAEGSTRAEAAFRQLYLNQWVSSDTCWIAKQDWDASPAADRGCKPFPAGVPVYGGLDVGVRNDLTSLCWLWIDGEVWRCRWQFFMPEEAVRRLEKLDGNPYSQWVRDGWIELTGGETLDDGAIIHAIKAATDVVYLENLAFDPAKSRYIVGSKELEHLEKTKVATTFRTMTEAMLRAEKLVTDGKIDHGCNPVASWCIDSTTARRTDDGQYMRPAKRTRDGARNDGAVAFLNAIVAALEAGEGAGDPVKTEFAFA